MNHPSTIDSKICFFHNNENAGAFNMSGIFPIFISRYVLSHLMKMMSSFSK